MDKDKILKLLQSTLLSDIFIAIELAYLLSFEEFDAIFGEQVPTKVLPEKDVYYFTRNNKIYFMGCAYLGRVKLDRYTKEEASKQANLTEYIDLTPIDYGQG